MTAPEEAVPLSADRTRLCRECRGVPSTSPPVALLPHRRKGGVFVAFIFLSVLFAATLWKERSGAREFGRERASGSLSNPLKTDGCEATVDADFPFTKVI